MGFFDSIVGTFNSVVSGIGNGAKSVVNFVRQDLGVDAIVGEGWGAVKSVGGAIGGTVSKGQDIANNLVNKGADTLDSLGSSLSFPLLLIGGAAAIFLLTRK